MEHDLQRSALQCIQHGAIRRSLGEFTIAAIVRRPEFAIERAEDHPTRTAPRLLTQPMGRPLRGWIAPGFCPALSPGRERATFFSPVLRESASPRQSCRNAAIGSPL